MIPTRIFTRTTRAVRKETITDTAIPEVDKLVDQQSMEPDQEKRRQLVWMIERKLAEDGARPIIFYAPGGNCRQSYVKGVTLMVNSIYNGWRMEDVWLYK
jgi:peptide/nickel transport system substrate-binding protein